MKRTDADSPGHLPRTISEARRVYACPFLEIQHSTAVFELFAKDYYVVKFKRRAGVVAVHAGSVLMAKQYRFLLRGYSWELPGGSIEDSEDFEQGIIRECYEETGVRLSKLQKLLSYYPGLDNVDNPTTVFASELADTTETFLRDPREVSQIAWMPLERCIEMIFSGEILDAMTIAGLLAYARRRQAP